MTVTVSKPAEAEARARPCEPRRHPHPQRVPRHTRAVTAQALALTSNGPSGRS
jgi:hypothetical protein